MAPDQAATLIRARRAYERGRALRAVRVAVPLLCMAMGAVYLGTGIPTAFLVGIGLLVTAWLLVWRGQSLGRSVLPGVVAGIVPLTFSLCARSYGHLCSGDSCVSLCIPACTAGGAIAGFFVARAARRAQAPWHFLAGGSALAVMVGALGCSCVGYGGVVGLVTGLIVTLIPTWLGSRLVVAK